MTIFVLFDRNPMGTHSMIFAFFTFSNSILSAIISHLYISTFDLIRMTEVCKSIESITFYAYVTCRTCYIIKVYRLIFTFVQRLCPFRWRFRKFRWYRSGTVIPSLRKFTDYLHELSRIYISICREVQNFSFNESLSSLIVKYWNCFVLFRKKK